MLHAAYLVIAGACLLAGWWQVHRAMAGNTLSYLYSVEWPAFAVVAGIGWWKMFHDTPEDIAERKAFHARMRAASAEVVARTLPRSALAITVGSEARDNSRALLRGHSAEDDVAMASITSSSGEDDRRDVALLRTRDPDARAADDARLITETDGGDDGAPGDDMTEYNRYLALLAVRGRAKTWRNPHGV
jgi:hypothetical protein